MVFSVSHIRVNITWRIMDIGYWILNIEYWSIDNGYRLSITQTFSLYPVFVWTLRNSNDQWILHIGFGCWRWSWISIIHLTNRFSLSALDLTALSRSVMMNGVIEYFLGSEVLQKNRDLGKFETSELFVNMVFTIISHRYSSSIIHFTIIIAWSIFHYPRSAISWPLSIKIIIHIS